MANSSGGIINTLVGPAKNDTERDARTVAAALAWTLVIGSVFAISWQRHYWAAACMWAGACALVGMLLGFLFGIPRFLSRSGMTATIPATDKQLEAGGPAAAAVILTEPATGATVSGRTVTLTATAGTGLTVASVQFKVDGSNVGAALTASPYTSTLDSTTLSEGAHSITAAVTDSAGNTSTSAAVSIIVSNTTTAVSVAPPTAVQQTFGGVNTNLEEISDWLTKIIVGVSLVELQKAQSKLQGAAGFIAQTLGGASQTSFAYGLMIYFSIVGFLGSYLLTRLYLQRAFRDAASGQ